MSSATPLPSAERDWRLFVRDMVEFCDQVLAYTEGHDMHSLNADRMRRDATLRNLELIGEAATHVPPEVRASAPDIPWRLIVGLRNRLIHAYLAIEPETVWGVITQHLPPLRQRLAVLADSPFSDPASSS
jgi:uncharacterized protein with HEPN domain